MKHQAKDLFETITCPRCHGTGEYSFNLKDGTVCYGCHGRKYKFTPRGAAAKKYLEDKLTLKAKDVEVGMFIRIDRGRVRINVKSIDVNECEVNGNTYYTFHGKFSHTLSADMEVRRNAKDDAEMEAFVADALAYQDKLTKTGKLMKKYQ